MSTIADLRDLSPLPGAHPAAPIHSNRFGPSALLVAQVTAFFDQLPAESEGLVEAYRRVMTAVAPHLTWWRTDAQRGADPIRPEDLETLPKWFSAKARKRSEYEIAASSGSQPGELGPWGFSFAVEREELPSVKGHFQFCFPAALLEGEGAEQLESLVHGLCEDFPWTSMTAGYAVTVDPGEIEPDRDVAIRNYAMRYLGVECNDLISESELAPGLFKSVNWLTFLGARAAGRAELGRAVPSELALTTFRHGILIKAGDRPVLGDRSRRQELSAYATADRLLRKARAHHLFPLPGFENEAAARQWLCRFETEIG